MCLIQLLLFVYYFIQIEFDDRNDCKFTQFKHQIIYHMNTLESCEVQTSFRCILMCLQLHDLQKRKGQLRQISGSPPMTLKSQFQKFITGTIREKLVLYLRETPKTSILRQRIIQTTPASCLLVRTMDTHDSWILGCSNSYSCGSSRAPFPQSGCYTHHIPPTSSP